MFVPVQPPRKCTSGGRRWESKGAVAKGIASGENDMDPCSIHVSAHDDEAVPESGDREPHESAL
jgi:hypothetical protein